MIKNLLLLPLLLNGIAHADVFPDLENLRREPTMEEKQHLLRMGGPGKGACSASAITPEIMITAEHCLSRYVNGVTLLDLVEGYFEADPTQKFKVQLKTDPKSRKKIPVILDVSSHYENDMILVKIKWESGKAPDSLRYTREIAMTEADLKLGQDSEATPLFAIGYPMDRNYTAAYSTGFAKEKDFPGIAQSMKDPYTGKQFEQAVFLKVNVPLTNGNSGGPVYTGNYKLVGTVHGGSAASDADRALDPTSQNPRLWNRIAPIFQMYPKMKTLQEHFPNGVNPNVNENGEWIGK